MHPVVLAAVVIVTAGFVVLVTFAVRTLRQVRRTAERAEATLERLAPTLDRLDLLIDEARIVCVPGSAFGMEGHLRLSYAVGEREIHDGLDRMDAALQRM